MFTSRPFTIFGSPSVSRIRLLLILVAVTGILAIPAELRAAETPTADLAVLEQVVDPPVIGPVGPDGEVDVITYPEVTNKGPDGPVVALIGTSIDNPDCRFTVGVDQDLIDQSIWGHVVVETSEALLFISEPMDVALDYGVGVYVEIAYELGVGEVFPHHPIRWGVACEAPGPNEAHFVSGIHIEAGDDPVLENNHFGRSFILEVGGGAVEVDLAVTGTELFIDGDLLESLVDSDVDGLPDSTEKLIGTDPENWDTDGDGLSDEEEVRGNSDPLIPDSPPVEPVFSDDDQLTDFVESLIGTDPFNVDTDGDGPWDGHEFYSGGDPLDDEVFPIKPTGIPGSEQFWVESAQGIALSPETYPEDAGPVVVRLEDYLLSNPSCDISYQITPEIEAAVDELAFFALAGEDRWPIEPDEDGLVSVPPETVLEVEAHLVIEPGEVIGIPGLWGMSCDGKEPAFELHKFVWPADENVFDFDPVNNDTAVFVPMEVAPEEIEIDVKPGGDPNSINLKSKGVVPVAILTTEKFDASEIDPGSVVFAGTKAAHLPAGHLEDVDGDGDVDLVLHFSTQELELAEGDEEASVRVLTWDGIEYVGFDKVRIVKGK